MNGLDLSKLHSEADRRLETAHRIIIALTRAYGPFELHNEDLLAADSSTFEIMVDKDRGVTRILVDDGEL
jgi:hypothetical protein